MTAASTDAGTQEVPTTYAKNMDPNVMPDIDLYLIEETYPNMTDPRHTCQNSAVPIEITQTYFLCHPKDKPNTIYRVTQQTYNDLTFYPYFQRTITCETKQQSNPACYCAAGYSGAYCNEPSYSKCYVNMTTPKLYEGCNKPDSDYYVYSIQGFDPCFFYDFTQQYEFKYLLNCKPIDDNGVVEPKGHAERLGYNYADVVEMPTLQPSDFTYAAVNN